MSGKNANRDVVNENNITVLTDVSLITCIVQRGQADDIVNAAQEAGAQGATIHYGQGSGMQEVLGILSVAIDMEKEIINIVVGDDQADRIYERMYIAGKLDTPGMGIMYMTRLEKAATYIPADILERLLENE